MLKINSKTIAGLFVAFALAFALPALAWSPSTATIIKKGSAKADVLWLQQTLNATAGTTLVEDGLYGKKTTAAIKAFQVGHPTSGKADGIAGKMTIAALNAAGASIGNNTQPLCPNGMTLASNCTLPPTGTVINNQTGPLSVALSSDNPAAGNVLSGQALADLAHFTFSGNGTLTQVTLQRTGLSTSADISNVYLFDGNTRLTEGASVNTNGQIIFNGLNIAVSGSKNLSVKADMASSTTSVSLGVTLTGYMVSGGTTANAVNVAGNLMFVSTAPNNISTITLGSQTATTATINAGSLQYTLWSGSVAVSGRTAILKGANFRVIGSAPTDAVQNIKLYVDGTPVGNPAMVGANNYAFLDFGASPVNLTTGSHTIDLRGDIQKGSSRTVQFSIQNAADLLVTDSQLGINIALASAGLSSYGSAGVITISTGSVTTTVDPTFQAMTNVTGGATNAVIARYKMHAYGEDVKVQTLTLTPSIASATYASTCSGSCTAGSMNNVTLYLNGAQVGSSYNYTGSALPFSLGSSVILKAGVDSMLEVRADLQTNTNINYTGGTVTVSLAAGSSNGQGMSSLLTSINVPSSTLATSGLSIQTGSLSVAKNTALANQSISPNTTGATIGSFVLQNQSTSESVRVSNLAVGLVLAGSPSVATSTNYSNLKTDETSGSGNTPINPATAAAGATSSNNFSVNFTLAPGATKVINVISDISSATASLSVTLVPTAIGVSSNVNVTPSSVTGQTITVQSATFGTPSLITSASTTAQFIAAATGNTDGSKAEFNLSSTNGAATVTEAKFVVRGSSTVSGLGTVTSVRLGSATAPIVLATTNSTTLSATATAGDLVATIASGTGVADGSILLIDSEQLLVGTSVDATHWNVTRGYNSTTAAAHIGGSTVSVKNGVAYFTGLNIAIPNSTAGINVDAYPTYSAVGTNGVTSGSVAALSLSYLKYTLGNSTQTSCVASLSCNTNITEVAAPTMTVVGSKPVITAAKPTGVTLSAASTPAIDVTVAADAKGDITLVGFPITVGLTGASVSTSSTSNIAVYLGSDLSTNYASSNTAFSGATGGSSTITLTNSGYRISAGQSVVFHVYVTPVGIAAANPGNDQMATSLATGSNFTWTDTAGGGSATTGTTNIFGYPSSFTSIITN